MEISILEKTDSGGREGKRWKAMDEDRTDEIIRDILEHWDDEEGDGTE